MKKIPVILLCLALLAGSIGLSWLCTHPNLLPDVETEYKTAGQAQTAQGDDALLMALLMGGGAAPAPAAEEDAFSLTISSYGLYLSIGAVLALGLLLAQARFRTSIRSALLWTAGLSLPLALMGARAVYCFSNLSFYLQFPQAILKIWEGGLSLTGTLYFAVLAGVLGAKIGKAQTGKILSAMIPSLLVFLFFVPIAQRQIGAGYGPEMDAALPLLTREINGIHRLHTPLLTTVFILPLTLMLRQKRPADQSFPLFAFLYGSGMILLESLRRDGHMLMGFVHIEMVLDIGIAFPALLYFAKKAKRIPQATAASLLLAGAVIGLEFALDRSTIGDIWLYLVYAACLAGYIWMGCSCAKQAAHV